MPFSDETSPEGVKLKPYQSSWVSDFLAYRDELKEILGSLATAIDHIGSTSIPGMVSKDCIDIQVRVNDPHNTAVEELMGGAGFRKRPEPWNSVEVSWEQESKKQVYAQAIGRRACNIHIRGVASASARYALLFRDYLVACPKVRDDWSEFKQLLAQEVFDLNLYGTIKQPATHVLMAGALHWAESNHWTPTFES